MTETPRELAIRRAETLREWALNVQKSKPDDADRILSGQILDLTEYVLFDQKIGVADVFTIRDKTTHRLGFTSTPCCEICESYDIKYRCRDEGSGLHLGTYVKNDDYVVYLLLECSRCRYSWEMNANENVTVGNYYPHETSY